MTNEAWLARLEVFHQKYHEIANGEPISLPELTGDVSISESQEALGILIYGYRLGKGTVYILGYHGCIHSPIWAEPVHEGFPPDHFVCPNCEESIKHNTELSYEFGYVPNQEKQSKAK